MRDVFISHAEEDARIATAIAAGLQAVGFTTWSYEDDSDVGFSYLSQIDQEIEETQCLLLIISKHSLDSDQVTKEIVRAHEARKPLLPVRYGLSHDEVQRRREWRMALGAAVSMQVPQEGVPGLMPRILKGLDRMGVVPSGTPNGAPTGAPALDQAQRRTGDAWSSGSHSTGPTTAPHSTPGSRSTSPAGSHGTGTAGPGPLDHFLSGTKPETMATVAIGIGALGAIWNLWRFLAALSPNDGQDAWQLQAFPWLQVGNILLGFVGLILYVGVLMGGLQLRQGQPGGARLLRSSAFGLLAMTGLWFVGALLAMMGSDRWEQIPDRYQASAVAGLLGTTLIGALLATFLVVVSRKRPD